MFACADNVTPPSFCQLRWHQSLFAAGLICVGWGLEGCLKAESTDTTPSLYLCFHVGPCLFTIDVMKISNTKTFGSFYLRMARHHTKSTKMCTNPKFPAMYLHMCSICVPPLSNYTFMQFIQPRWYMKMELPSLVKWPASFVPETQWHLYSAKIYFINICIHSHQSCAIADDAVAKRNPNQERVIN